MNIYPTINKGSELTDKQEFEEANKIYPTIKKPLLEPEISPVQLNPTTPAPTTPIPIKPNTLDSYVPAGMDAEAVLLAKAIRQHESGNVAQIPGEGSEVGGASLYQYTHGTWKSTAQKYLGDANAPMTRENENKATYLKILDWKKKGYNPAQIASMWNAGEGKPNAYAENWRGVNKWGVAYDTPSYVNKVYNTYKQLKDEYSKTSIKNTEKIGDTDIDSFVGNILNQYKKTSGETVNPEKEQELIKQIETNKNALIDMIKTATKYGVDESLATRLVERGMYDKLQELIQSSGSAQKMAKDSKLNFTNVINTIFSAEKMLGELFGQTIAMKSKDTKAMQTSQLELQQQTTNLIKTIRENKANGKDTTRLEKQLSDLTNIPSTEFEDIFNVQNLTNKQVIGASVGTVLDALGGSFTKAGASKIATKLGQTAEKEIATNFAKGLVKKSTSDIVKNVGKTALVLGKEGAGIGTAYGVGLGMMNDENLGGIIKSGVSGGIAGGVMGATLGAFTSGIASNSYNKLATKNYENLSKVSSQNSKLNAIQKVGVKISNTYVKPSSTDINNGYKTENLAKYDVGGSIDKALPKVQQKLRNYTDQLNEYIKLKGDEPTIKYGEVISELENEYSKNKKIGFIGDTNSELNKLKSELKQKYGENWVNQEIGFTNAIEDKRSAGIKSIFNHDPLKNVKGASETVWNDFYSSLKKTLEEKSPIEYKDINKAISELIPIEQAYIRRLRQLDKNNIFNIYDFIGGTGAIYNPKMLAVPIIARLSKSPKIANILMKAGNIEKALGSIPTDELSKLGIIKQDNSYSFDGLKINRMNLEPKETRSIVIKVKNILKNKNLPGYADLSIFDKKSQVKSNIEAKKIIDPKKPTTKILNELNGKTNVKRQFIEDLTRKPDISKVEKEIISEALKTEGDIIDTKLFAKKVQNELLPLKKVDASIGGSGEYRYENVVLPKEIRGNVVKYKERVYASPIKTSAGDIHFSSVRDENYFGHTRVEDLANTIKGADKNLKIVKGNSEVKPFKVIGDGVDQNFSTFEEAQKGLELFKTTLKTDSSTRRVIEVQTDLYQKGRLEKDAYNNLRSGDIISINNGKPSELFKFNNTISADGIDFTINDIALGKYNIKVIKSKAIEKLKQYNDPTAHFRMVREEVKQAAIDGKSKLQFPTGETAMKIEGLDESNSWGIWEQGMLSPATTRDLKIGNKINDRNDEAWIITEVLGDGKFKAIQKGNFDGGFESLPKQVQRQILNNEKISNSSWKSVINQLSEQFDISGKIDTSNPIYKFYQETLGKYLKNKYNAKEITDSKGVKWYEIDIDEKMKNEPVLAFGLTDIKTLLSTAGIMGTSALIASIIASKKEKKSSDTNEPKEVNQTAQDNLEPKKDINASIEDYIKTIKVEINETGSNLGNTLAKDNNNPGNLIFAGQPNALKGDGGFAKFPTPELGFRALIKQVQADQRRNLSLRDFITKYAPPTENNTEKYIKDVSSELGIEESKNIAELDPIELAKKMAKFESQTVITE